MAKVYATPGVYIEEKSAFPNSAVPVPTAVPAFIGYTERVIHHKESLLLKPTRLSSLGEYLLYFGGGPKITYGVENIRHQDPKQIYKVESLSSRYFLYNSMRMFFANGGSGCYIISVGNYDDAITQATLAKGIDVLSKEPEPTMVVIPDAVLLGKNDCYNLQKQMLKHCGQEMRNRVAILDIHQGYEKQTPEKDVIRAFREGIGEHFLQWGAAYYPWVHSTIIAADEVDFTNIDASTMEVFMNLLKEQVTLDVKAGRVTQERANLINAEIDAIKERKNPKTLHQTLLAIHPLYKSIMNSVREHMNLLPPSAGMAGIYSMVDNLTGVWQSPANVSIGSVIKPSVNLTNDEQEDLNVPLNGKAINAIRTFPGKGPLVWGARTLDGNSQDWRYISVRRTVIFIEQSIKYAAEAYVFEPNTVSTWTNLKALINNFLTNVWQQGALAGATAEDAFSVDVGLGVTMTPVDILDGIMRISVKIAVTRPAEFIVITFQQEMQQS